MTILKQLKNGLVTLDPRLDRVEDMRESNRGYTVERLLSERRELLEAELRASRSHRPGPGLNQGQEGQCVLYACTHRRNATPKRLKPLHLDQAAIGRDYHVVQHSDPWDGCDEGARCPVKPGPEYGGTSVTTAMDYGRNQGWWSSFWWVGAGSGDAIGDVVKANRAVGGIVYGLPWLESMFTPRPSGLVEVDRASKQVGGHAIYGPAVRLKMRLPGEWTGTQEVAVIQQSWGEDYGVADLGRPGGMVYLKLDDLDWLLHQGGEGAVVVR